MGLVSLVESVPLVPYLLFNPNHPITSPSGNPPTTEESSAAATLGSPLPSPSSVNLPFSEPDNTIGHKTQ